MEKFAENRLGALTKIITPISWPIAGELVGSVKLMGTVEPLPGPGLGMSNASTWPNPGPMVRYNRVTPFGGPGQPETVVVLSGSLSGKPVPRVSL